jgi:cytochrome P450
MGGYFITRYADAKTVLADRDMLRSPDRAAPSARAIRLQRSNPSLRSLDYGKPPGSILLLDDPAHTRIRAPLAQALYERVARSRLLIEGVVDGILSPLAEKDEFDVVIDYAHRIPIHVMCRILGIPREFEPTFRNWSEAAALALHPMRSRAATVRMEDAQNALHEYFLGSFAQRRARPTDDLIGDVVRLQLDGWAVSDHELQANLRLLLIAGNLTTGDLIGSSIWLLLNHRDQLSRLKSEPGRIGRVIEECLRMESPIDATDRVAPGPTTLAGCPIAAGNAITLSLRAANRDPDVFDRPHEFDIDRTSAGHVAFGGGAHFCLGAPLARLETQIAVLAFFQELPDLELADPYGSPCWRPLPPFRGLEKLSVRTMRSGSS